MYAQHFLISREYPTQNGTGNSQLLTFGARDPQYPSIFFFLRRDDETKNVSWVEPRPSKVPDSRVRHLQALLNGADERFLLRFF